MKVAEPWWLLGSGVALMVAGFLILGGVLLMRSVRRFGDEKVVLGLLTSRPGGRRAAKGTLLVLAVALGFVALAQPQYGKGTRLIPATDLDVVVVLDYSKSMYARDVTPSRIARAKSEVSRLIKQLPGARFGAVAFAGESLSYPMTSDGGAIAQFFRQLNPNDMPVGGTAIGRSLVAARQLFERDPLSKKHKRVILLVTDGEDLEGDPVRVAEAAKNDGITIFVVQIGDRTAEPIPEVNEAGEVVGMRTDDDGNPITTSLTAEGEKQLTRIAEVTGGNVVRSARGSTGLREITTRLKRLMTEELSEKVETVYADVYQYPLGAMIVLLIIEVFIGEARRRKAVKSERPPGDERAAKTAKSAGKSGGGRRAALGASAAILLSFWGSAGCETTDSWFERNSPAVDQALAGLDAGDAGGAMELLAEYLSTGKCSAGQIGTPDTLETRANAGYDLGLALFLLGEQFGRRFGEEEMGLSDAGPTPEQQSEREKRAEQVGCALAIVRLIAADHTQPIDLRARAHYLAGNLEFLNRDYRAAVKEYDKSLALIPGLPEDAGDGTGRDAAWNRAIALRRIQDEEDEPDASPDSPPDAPPDAPPDGGDGGDDAGSDGGDDGGNDAGGGDAGQDGGDQNQGPDAGAGDAGGRDGGSPNQPPPQDPEKQSADQDERLLDMLERAPTLQHQDAKDRALSGRVRGMEDK